MCVPQPNGGLAANRSLSDLQGAKLVTGEAKALSYPVDQLTTVGTIDPDLAQVFAGSAQSLEQQACSSRIRDRGCGDYYHGHIRFLRSRAKNIVELEAIAKNAMQNVSTVLKYGKMGNKDSLAIVDTLCSDDGAVQSESLPPTSNLDPLYANAFRQSESILAEIKCHSGEGVA